MRTIIITLAAALGIGLGANGVVMLMVPADWYFAVPGVTSTGPFNQHFIRDIGMIYIGVGIALLMGAARPGPRAWLWGGAAAWLSAHAVFHGWEVAVGLCGPDAIARDFPAVTLPALITTALALWAARGPFPPAAGQATHDVSPGDRASG